MKVWKVKCNDRVTLVYARTDQEAIERALKLVFRRSEKTIYLPGDIVTAQIASKEEIDKWMIESPVM